ncbi:MAG: leucyl/phenylalanyl-tRNA--protein transferase [Candidatus Promineifilaceae bacterium]
MTSSATETSAYLAPQFLLSAYWQGIFPMADDDGTIYWYDPDPRAVLPLESFHVSRSLQRVLSRREFEIKFDTSFEEVIRACAAPAVGREETWISSEIIEAYVRLHKLGFAHSVEAWRNGRLAGGLYGVALNGLFAGESMFSRESNASKVALAALVEHLCCRNFLLLDIQFLTEHLAQFGAIEISRRAYQQKLAAALSQPAGF